MKYFDTHTHIFKEYYSDLERKNILKECKDNNFGYIMMPSCTPDECLEVMDYQNDWIKVAFGIHPSEAHGEYVLDFAHDLDISKYDAIGEIGLDTHWDSNPPLEEQIKVFKKQLDLALAYNKTVIIHNRHETEKVIAIINNKKYQDLTFIFHSFTDGVDEIKMILEKTNAYIAFNGVVTFKNAHQVREALKLVPMDRLIVETDAPFLSPEPVRGTTNKPLNMKYTITRIANILEMNEEVLASIVYKNSLLAYGLLEK